MTYDVITIGSALVDIFIHSESFAKQSSSQSPQKTITLNLGDKIELDSFNIHSGGGASNTAVGFSRLDLKTAIISETGQDKFSHIIVSELNKENVETQLIIHENKEHTGGSVILIGENGARTVMVHRGAASQLDPYDISSYWLSKTKWIHLSSIAGRLETLNKIFSLTKKLPKLNLSWNPGSAELELLSSKKLPVRNIKCRVLFMNKQEWEKIENVQQELLDTVPQIIITDGGNGGEVFLDGQHSLHFDSLNTKSVDDTGAGDAFATGYIAAQILHKPPTESVKWGVRNASSVVGFHGAKAGLLRKKYIKTVG